MQKTIDFMIQSMTGYGKATAELPEKKINVEIKSLNSKAMDLSARIAPAYREKEMEIRNEISRTLERGKVDFSLWVEKKVPTGTFMARMMPVTTADRSLMGLGFLSSLQYNHSKATLAMTDTAVTSSARTPKMMAEATTQGHRATITLAIRLCVVSSLRTCGEAETISFVSIT